MGADGFGGGAITGLSAAGGGAVAPDMLRSAVAGAVVVVVAEIPLVAGLDGEPAAPAGGAAGGDVGF